MTEESTPNELSLLERAVRVQFPERETSFRQNVNLAESTQGPQTVLRLQYLTDCVRRFYEGHLYGEELLAAGRSCVEDCDWNTLIVLALLALRLRDRSTLHRALLRIDAREPVYAAYLRYLVEEVEADQFVPQAALKAAKSGSRIARCDYLGYRVNTANGFWKRQFWLARFHFNEEMLRAEIAESDDWLAPPIVRDDMGIVYREDGCRFRYRHGPVRDAWLNGPPPLENSHTETG